MVTTRRVVVAGTESELGKGLAAHYRGAGDEVTGLDLAAGADLDALVQGVPDSVELFVIADGYAPADRTAASLTRDELAAGLYRLTYTPFHLASLLRPRLARAGGHAVLLTRGSAAMGGSDSSGRYLERPFRAAAHALWRCLSVEWSDPRVKVSLLALADGPTPPALEIAAAVERLRNVEGLVSLVSISGSILDW